MIRTKHKPINASYARAADTYRIRFGSLVRASILTQCGNAISYGEVKQ